MFIFVINHSGEQVRYLEGIADTANLKLIALFSLLVVKSMYAVVKGAAVVCMIVHRLVLYCRVC